MRQNDHDKKDLFPITEENTFHRYSPGVRVKMENNIYHSRDLNLIRMSAKEKKFHDAQSHIFYDPTPQPKQKVIPKEPQQAINNHRDRMLYMSSSHMLPGFSNNFQKVQNEINKRQKIDENPNQGIKHQNQMFSDMFGRECGEKQSTRKVIQRSASPTADWTQYDSIKSKNDTTTNEYSIHTSRQSPTKRISTMTDEFLNCSQQAKVFKGYAQIHGKVQRSQKVQYSGLLKWKNNYK